MARCSLLQDREIVRPRKRVARVAHLTILRTGQAQFFGIGAPEPLHLTRSPGTCSATAWSFSPMAGRLLWAEPYNTTPSLGSRRPPPTTHPQAFLLTSRAWH